MKANFLLLAISVAFYFYFSASGWNAARIYFDLFAVFLTAVALLFLELWAVDPARRDRAASSMLVPLILAFHSCGVLFDGDGDGDLDLYFHAYLVFLASVAAVFARVCVADASTAPTAVTAAPTATAALIVFLFLKLGAAVVFSCYPTEGVDGGDADLPQFVLLAAGGMFMLAYM